MSIFGRTVSYRLTRKEALTVARFVRDEPLWPLIVAIFQLRRLSRSEFERLAGK